MPKPAKRLLGAVTTGAMKARSVSRGSLKLLGAGLARVSPALGQRWGEIMTEYYGDPLIESERRGDHTVRETKACDMDGI